MSLSIKLEIMKGHGAAGDRVARVIFRGELRNISKGNISTSWEVLYILHSYQINGNYDQDMSPFFTLSRL